MSGFVAAFYLSVSAIVLSQSPSAAQSTTSETTVTFGVRENIPIGSIVGNVFDASNGLIKAPLTAIEQIPNNFRLNLIDGSLSTVDVIDREYATSCSFLILYGDGSSFAKVVINIFDENDNVPRFESSQLEFNVSESNPVPKCWVLPSPKDGDDGNNSIVSVGLLVPSDQFGIEYDSNSQRLSLCIVKELDFEVSSTYSLTVRATDGGGKSADLHITIDVSDENDHVPIFEVPKYETSFDVEDAVDGKPLIFTKAVDLDGGVNGLVKYAISYDFPSSGLPFSIDEATGIISLIAQPSGFVLPETTYSFVVRAFDGGRPSLESEVPVVIRVTNVKKMQTPTSGITGAAAPTLVTRRSNSAVTFSIHRDYPPGSFVGDLNDDPNAKHLLRNSSYALSGGAFASFLTLSRVTGVLTLSRWLSCDLTSIVSERAEGHRPTDGYHVFRLRLAPTTASGLVSTAVTSNTNDDNNNNQNAQALDIIISVSSDADQLAAGCLAFQRPMYQFTVVRNGAATEDRTPGDHCFGRVQAVSSDRCSKVRYSLAASSTEGEPVGVNRVTGSICLTPDYWKQWQFSSVATFQIAASNGLQTAYSLVRVEFIGPKAAAAAVAINDKIGRSWNVTLPPVFKRNDVLFSLRSSEGLIAEISAKSPKEIKMSSSRSSLIVGVGPCGSASNQAADKCIADSSAAIFKTPLVFHTSRKSEFSLDILPACVSARSKGGQVLQVARLPLLSQSVLEVQIAEFSESFTSVDKKLQLKYAVSSDILVKALESTNGRVQCTFALDSRCHEFASISSQSGLLHLQSLPPGDSSHGHFDCAVYAISTSFPTANQSIATIRFLWPRKPIPTAIEASSYFSVAENAAVGTVVGTMPFSMRGSLLPFVSDWFHFDPATGTLKTAKPLDRETRQSYDLPGGIVVNVDDVNDNEPKCLFPDGYTRELFVPDQWDADEFYLGRIRAVDADYSSNGTIGHFQISSEDHPYFRINSVTGDLFATNVFELTREFAGVRKLLLRVNVSDNGVPRRLSTDCYVKIVFRKADNASLASVLSPIDLRLGEQVELPNLPSSEDISLLANFDGPLCDYLRITPAFDMLDGGTSRRGVAFTLSSEVHLEQSLFDQLSCAVYLNAHRVVVPFVLKLKDEQSNGDDQYDSTSHPRVLAFSTAFSSRRSSVVTNLNESFAGANPLRLEIVFCNRQSLLSIDSANNLVANWDFYVDGLLQAHCVISASSRRGLRRLTSVFVDFAAPKIDVDAVPQFILPLTTYVAKKIDATLVTAGMPVVSALAYTNAPKASVSYSLENSYDGMFSIDSSTGLVTFTRDLISSNNLFSPGSSITFRLVLVAKTTLRSGGAAIDNNTPSMSSTSFDFAVEWPATKQSGIHDFLIPENAPTGTIVGRLAVENYFALPSSVSVKFPWTEDISDAPIALPTAPSWNVVTTKELASFYRYGSAVRRVTVPLLITGSSSSSNDTTHIVIIRISLRDVNNAAPVFQERSIHLSVHENVEYGNLFQAIAFDADLANENQKISYFFAGKTNSLHHGLFTIDSTSGIVSCQRLDRETNDVYNLTIFASDGTHESSMDLVVQVSDSNDNAPTMQKPQFDISLSGRERVGDKIFQVTATDPDESKLSHSRLVFSLKDGFGLFELDSSSGDIRLVALPRPNQMTEWSLVVNVTDSVFSAGTVVVVHLEPDAMAAFSAAQRGLPTSSSSNEHPFSMSHQKAFIIEGMPKGAVVAQIAPRRRPDLKFNIKSGNADQSFFIDVQSADSTDVSVRTRTMLDADIRSLYTLTIVATNVTTGLEIGSCELSISVVDVNDNEPALNTFTPARAFVSSTLLDLLPGVSEIPVESTEVVAIKSTARPGCRLGMLNALDPDSPSRLSFSVVNDDAAQYLVVNPISGDVFLKRALPLGKVITAEFGVSDGKHRTNVRKMAFSTKADDGFNAGGSTFEPFRQSRSLLDHLADRADDYSIVVSQCVEGAQLLSLLPKNFEAAGAETKFSLITSSSSTKQWLSIDSKGVISLSHSVIPPTSFTDKISFVVSARIAGGHQFPLFLYGTLSGAKKCAAQPLISPSSVSSLELPRAATNTLKPGSILTKVDVDYLAGVVFKITDSNGFFGMDAGGNLRLLKPIPTHDFDSTIKVYAANPLSLHKSNTFHAIRIRVIGLPGEQPLTMATNSDAYKVVEFYLVSSVTSLKPTELLLLHDFAIDAPEKAVIAKSSSSGAFVIDRSRLMFLSAAVGSYVGGDHYVVVSSPSMVLVVIVHTDSFAKMIERKAIVIGDIAENTPLPAQFSHNDHHAPSELVDCEAVCCYASKVSNGIVDVPYLLRVTDSDEYPFAYEQDGGANNNNVLTIEFPRPSAKSSRLQLVGCLPAVDFDNGAAGVWKIGIVDGALPSFMRLSPVEGCLYVKSSEMPPSFDRLSFSVAQSSSTTTQVVVRVLQARGNNEELSSTRTFDGRKTFAATVVPGNNNIASEMPQRSSTDHNEDDDFSSTSSPGDKMILVLSTAIPLAFLLVTAFVVVAFYFRHRWRRYSKHYSSNNGSNGLGLGLGDKSSSDRRLASVLSRDADSGWIYRVMSALSSKQTTMIGRTNSFNTIGFTSVKYEPRPPSNSSSVQQQQPANRSSLCIAGGGGGSTSLAQQLSSSMAAPLYTEINDVTGSAAIIQQQQQQQRQVLPTGISVSAGGGHASFAFRNGSRTASITAVCRQSESGGSVSSGVEVSSTSGSNSGTASCSPPLVVTTISGLASSSRSPISGIITAATPSQHHHNGNKHSNSSYFTYNSNYEAMQQQHQLIPTSNSMVFDTRLTPQKQQQQQQQKPQQYVAGRTLNSHQQQQQQLPHSVSYYAASQTAGHGNNNKARRSNHNLGDVVNNIGSGINPSTGGGGGVGSTPLDAGAGRSSVLYTRCTRAPVTLSGGGIGINISNDNDSLCHSQYV